MSINKSTILLLIILFLSFAFTPKRLNAEGYNLASQALYSSGEAYLKEGRYAEARLEFEKCLMLNPEHKKAKALLELCQEKSVKATKDESREKAIQLALDGQENIIKQEPEAPKTILAEKESFAPPIGKGAWTLKEGQIYTELYTKYYWHRHQFDGGRGKRKRWDYAGKGDELRTELKLEYGFNDRLTLMLYTVAKEAHWKDSFKSCTRKGFTETWPGVKYLLFENPFICSLQGKIKFPLHYSEEAVPALGTHQIDEEIKVLTGQPWPKLPGYTKFELGYRVRQEEPADEIPYYLEFGYNLTPGIILKTTLDGKEGLAPQFGGKDEDLLKGTLGPIFKIGNLFNIEFGYGNTFAGKNTSSAQEVFLTLSSQY